MQFQDAKLMETHDAIFKRLNEGIDEEISEIGGIPPISENIGIHDYLPPDEEMPWILLGKLVFKVSEDLSDKFGVGYVLNQKIHVATKAMEKHEAIEVVKHIMKLLSPVLEIEGASSIFQSTENGSVEEIDDGVFYSELDFEVWITIAEEEKYAQQSW